MIRHVNRSDDQTNSLLSMMKHEQKQKLKKSIKRICKLRALFLLPFFIAIHKTKAPASR